MIWALLSGILIGTNYIPFPPWALLFALVPLWTAWFKTPNVKFVFWSGWLTQFVLTLIGFHWIAYTTVEFGHMPWFVGVLVQIAFCCFANLHYPLSGLLWLFVQKRVPMGALASVCLLALFLNLGELLWPMIFPWNLGYPWLWSRLPIFQLGDLIGTDGLSLISLLGNVLCFFIWQQHKNPKQALRLALCGLVCFVALNLSGFLRTKSLAPPNKILKVLAVQGN